MINKKIKKYTKKLSFILFLIILLILYFQRYNPLNKRTLNAISWDDTYNNLRLPLFGLAFESLQCSISHLPNFTNRRIFIEKVLLTFQKSKPLRTIRVEKLNLKAGIWKCVWLIEYANSNRVVYYISDPYESGEILESYKKREKDKVISLLIESIETNMISTYQKVDLKQFNDMWQLMKANKVWDITPKCSMACDASSYFLSIYSFGKTHQVAGYAIDNAPEARELFEIVNTIFHTFETKPPKINESEVRKRLLEALEEENTTTTTKKTKQHIMSE